MFYKNDNHVKCQEITVKSTVQQLVLGLLFYTVMLLLKQLCDFTVAVHLTHNFDVYYCYLWYKSVHRICWDSNPGPCFY